MGLLTRLLLSHVDEHDILPVPLQKGVARML